jgi:hypothetical protein
MSPLFGAVEWGDPELVKLLLDAGADPDVKERNGKTLFAINAGLHDKTIKAMLKQASLKRKGPAADAGSGLFCWLEDDGKEAKLGLEGLVPGDIIRLERIVLKE